MSLSIPRQYPGRAPAGERQAECDYCGCKFYRSTMRRDAAGFLRCEDDFDGKDTVTLDRENAANAASVRGPRPAGGGSW